MCPATFSACSTIAYYFGVFSMAWDLLFGFANEVNFGPTFLIGLGAYTAGILDNLYQPPICALRRSPARPPRSSAASCWRCRRLRVRGPYFGLTTLVAVLMLQNFVVVAAGLTGGEIGLTVPDVISIDDKVNYWIALGFMAVSGAFSTGSRARRSASSCRRAARTRCRPARSASTSPSTSSRPSSSAPSSPGSPAR